MKGAVYLVGAGPGDPDLLTLKAVRLLKSADVVLHDDLVSTEILALVSPKAEIRNVGKRWGTKKISQLEINFLMVALAESGLEVVRLKSGDPLVFGRGGEEIEALRKAGIQLEIVPGVTAGLAVAAAAQIPLTHRDLSHALIFLTGNSADGREADWKKLVASRTTLAIYMPGNDYDALARRLIDAGVPAETPCAVISAASTREQRILVGTVAAVPDSRHLPTPSLFIVGEVVRFAQALDDTRAHLPAALNENLSVAMPELSQLMANKEIA